MDFFEDVVDEIANAINSVVDAVVDAVKTLGQALADVVSWVGQRRGESGQVADRGRGKSILDLLTAALETGYELVKKIVAGSRTSAGPVRRARRRLQPGERRAGHGAEGHRPAGAHAR